MHINYAQRLDRLQLINNPNTASLQLTGNSPESIRVNNATFFRTQVSSPTNAVGIGGQPVLS